MAGKRSPAAPASADGAKAKSGAAHNTTPARRGKAQRWKAEHPLEIWAQTATRSAVRRGLLVKPATCDCGCGSTAPLDAHHPDYRNPLWIVWLTRRCHRRLHVAQRRAGK